MLNARHKFFLFVTLVSTGSALLVGATFSQGLGLAILGATFAWLAGSAAVSRFFTSARRLPSRLSFGLMLPFMMAVAGALFAIVAYYSNLNLFLSVAAMVFTGVVTVGYNAVAIQHPAARVAVYIAGVLAFLFVAIFAASLMFMPAAKMERFGELAISALVGLWLGRMWVTKGCALIVDSLRPDAAPSGSDPSQQTRALPKGTLGLCFSLILGSCILLVFLGLLAFNSFSESIEPFQQTPRSNQALGMTLMLLFLTWWPYTALRAILDREANTTRNVIRHKRTLIAIALISVAIMTIGVAFGIQNGYDRRLTRRIESTTREFHDIATQIGTLKSRNFATTQDYIEAYTQMTPLLDDFDRKLETIVGVLAESKTNDMRRGLLNIQLLYPRHGAQMEWSSEVFRLLKDDSALTRRQITIVNEMALLPEGDQVEYWRRNFQPLALQEDNIRQKLTGIMKTAQTENARKHP